MKKTFYYIFILCITIFNFIPSGNLICDEIDDFTHRGIRATLLQNYKLAFATFDSLKLFTNNDPRPYFYHAAALQASMMDFEDYREENLFFELIKQTIKNSERWIKTDSLKARGYFFKGAALSYKGFYYAQKKEYLKGFRDAVTGIKLLQKVIQIDSTYYDAYLGIGSLKYWRSVLTQYINWLPIVGDQRLEGIAMIEKAGQYGRYGRDVALNSLIWIEMDRKNFERAIKLSLKMQEKFPGSRYFIWPLAESYLRAGLYEKAVIQFQRLIKSYRQEPNNNFYNEVICGFKIARSYQFQKNYSYAYNIALETINLSLEPGIKKRLKEKLKELKKIVEDCKKLIEDNNR